MTLALVLAYLVAAVLILGYSAFLLFCDGVIG